MQQEKSRVALATASEVQVSDPGDERRAAIASGAAVGLAALMVLVAVATLLARAGMNMAAAYFAALVATIAGALIMLRLQAAVLLLPSVPIASYLVYIVSISGGLSVAALFGVTALAATIALAIVHFARGRLESILPPVISAALPGALGVMLLVQALNESRIIIASPWSLTMLGNFADPLAYLALVGIVVTLALLALKIRGAVAIGAALTAAIALVEGFWVIPAAPFLLPERLDTTVLSLTLSASSDRELWLLVGAMLMLVVVLVTTNLAVLRAVGDATQGRSVQNATPTASTAAMVAESEPRLLQSSLAVSIIAGLVGTLPLTVTPLSIFGASDRAEARAFMGSVLGVLALGLFIEPIIAEAASFPAMVMPVLVVAGLLLLREFGARLRVLLAGRELRLAEVVALVVLLLVTPLSYNLAAGLGVALVLYVLLEALAGRGQIPRATYGLTTIMMLYLFFAAL